MLSLNICDFKEKIAAIAFRQIRTAKIAFADLTILNGVEK